MPPNKRKTRTLQRESRWTYNGQKYVIIQTNVLDITDQVNNLLAEGFDITITNYKTHAEISGVRPEKVGQS